MIHNILALGALGLVLSGCYRPPPATRADRVAKADCREQVERQYNAQNRANLTFRDNRDTAYSGSANIGLPSAGLGAEYGRETMLDACLRANADASGSASPGTSPANDPTVTGPLRP